MVSCNQCMTLTFVLGFIHALHLSSLLFILSLSFFCFRFDSQLTSSSSASTSTISSDGSDNSGGNNGNASSNKMTFTYVKLDEKQGNSNSVGSQRKAVKFGEKIQVDGTASSDAAGSAGTANSADPNQQLFHAYYAPAGKCCLWAI